MCKTHESPFLALLCPSNASTAVSVNAAAATPCPPPCLHIAEAPDVDWRSELCCSSPLRIERHIVKAYPETYCEITVRFRWTKPRRPPVPYSPPVRLYAETPGEESVRHPQMCSARGDDGPPGWSSHCSAIDESILAGRCGRDHPVSRPPPHRAGSVSPRKVRLAFCSTAGTLTALGIEATWPRRGRCRR